MGGGPEGLQQFGARRVPLHQDGKIQRLADQVRGLAQRPVAGEQEKRPSPGELQQRDRFFHKQTGKFLRPRIRQAPGQVQQGLGCEIERAVPAAGFDLFQAQARRKIVKLPVHAQGGRGKHVHALKFLHARPEHAGNVQGRLVQVKPLAADLQPADELVLFPLIEPVQQGRGRNHPLVAVVQRLAPGGEILQHLVDVSHLFQQDRQRAGDLLLFLHRGPGHPVVLPRKTQAQVAHRFFKPVQQFGEIRQVLGFLEIRRPGVGHQFQQLPAAQGLAEKLRCQFRQLVRLIEDRHFRGRQQLAVTGLLQHHVRQEQVVVDHGQVRVRGAAPGAEHETVIVKIAILVQAVIDGGNTGRPHRGILRDVRQLGQVAAGGALRPGADIGQVSPPLLVQPARVGLCLFQPVQAQVIGPSLQQRNIERPPDGLAHQGQVAGKQLVLQVPGAGGDDHLVTGLQRRRKIGKGLAGPGAGLADQ